MPIEKINLVFKDEQGTDFNKYGLIEDGGGEKQVTLRRLANITSVGTPLSAENLNTPINKINEIIDKINTKVDNAVNADNVTSLNNNDTGDNANVKFTIGNRSFSKTVNNVNHATNASSANKLSNSRNIKLTGDVIGNANFDGSGNIEIQTILIKVDSGLLETINNEIKQIKLEIDQLTNNSNERPPITSISWVGSTTMTDNYINILEGERVYDFEIGDINGDYKLIVVPNANSLASCTIQGISGDSDYIKFDYNGYSEVMGMSITATALKDIKYNAVGASQKTAKYKITITDIYDNVFTQEFTVIFKAK